jgi:hypothetical protein
MDVLLHHAATAMTVIVTETETVIATGTATVIKIMTGISPTVGIGIEIVEIGTTIIGTRRRMSIVSGAPTARAACRPSPSRKMMFLGPRLQYERMKVLACLPSMWIRTKNCFVAWSLVSFDMVCNSARGLPPCNYHCSLPHAKKQTRTLSPHGISHLRLGMLTLLDPLLEILAMS